MPTDLPDVTPAEIEAAIDLLCSRGWSPPNAHGFATDIRDAIIAARRRAPPLAAPATTTGEDERFVSVDYDALLCVLSAARRPMEEGVSAERELEDAKRVVVAALTTRATPPAAPAAVTAEVIAAAHALLPYLPSTAVDLAREPRGAEAKGEHFQAARRLAAALAAAAPAERGE